jgi:hypothetical protein
MSGSGTTGDVARQMGIPFWQSDLNAGFNVLQDEFPSQGDLIFFHDPYWDIIRYSGEVWGKLPHPDDLSRCPDYDTFIRKMDIAHYNGYQALRSGGHLVILVGDVKCKGLLYPLQRDYRWYGEPVQMLMKLQHNVWSNGQTYSGFRDPRIMHEYVIVTRKPKQFAVLSLSKGSSAWMVSVRKTERYQSDDQRDVKSQPWHGIVWTALGQLGGEAPLSEIYSEMKAHTRVKYAEEAGQDWLATTRRVLQETCQPVERGVWTLPTV